MYNSNKTSKSIKIIVHSLKELILDRNGIKELPYEFVELKNLRNISLAGNCFTSLPSFFNMRALALTVTFHKIINNIL